MVFDQNFLPQLGRGHEHWLQISALSDWLNDIIRLRHIAPQINCQVNFFLILKKLSAKQETFIMVSCLIFDMFIIRTNVSRSTIKGSMDQRL